MESRAATPVVWPMTAGAHELLLDEIAQLRHDVTTLAGQGLEEGVVRLALAKAARRLHVLDRIAADALVNDDSCVAIGRRVEVRDADGDTSEFSIVFPGDGDPLKGRISADSPLGSALLGLQSGATVVVEAPLGSWSATLIRVD